MFVLHSKSTIESNSINITYFLAKVRVLSYASFATKFYIIKTVLNLIRAEIAICSTLSIVYKSVSPSAGKFSVPEATELAHFALKSKNTKSVIKDEIIFFNTAVILRQVRGGGGGLRQTLCLA